MQPTRYLYLYFAEFKNIQKTKLHPSSRQEFYRARRAFRLLKRLISDVPIQKYADPKSIFLKYLWSQFWLLLLFFYFLFIFFFNLSCIYMNQTTHDHNSQWEVKQTVLAVIYTSSSGGVYTQQKLQPVRLGMSVGSDLILL